MIMAEKAVCVMRVSGMRMGCGMNMGSMGRDRSGGPWRGVGVGRGRARNAGRRSGIRGGHRSILGIWAGWAASPYALHGGGRTA